MAFTINALQTSFISASFGSEGHQRCRNDRRPASRIATGNQDKVEFDLLRLHAKRLLARVELFSTDIFDFAEVPTIGQAFADEVFRVFPQQHPNISLVTLRASPDVTRMIERVKVEGDDQKAEAEEKDIRNFEEEFERQSN